MKPVASRKVACVCLERCFAFSLLFLYFAKLHLSAVQSVCVSPTCFVDTGALEVRVSVFVCFCSLNPHQ